MVADYTLFPVVRQAECTHFPAFCSPPGAADDIQTLPTAPRHYARVANNVEHFGEELRQRARWRSRHSPEGKHRRSKSANGESIKQPGCLCRRVRGLCMLVAGHSDPQLRIQRGGGGTLEGRGSRRQNSRGMMWCHTAVGETDRRGELVHRVSGIAPSCTAGGWMEKKAARAHIRSDHPGGTS